MRTGAARGGKTGRKRQAGHHLPAVARTARAPRGGLRGATPGRERHAARWRQPEIKVRPPPSLCLRRSGCCAVPPYLPVVPCARICTHARRRHRRRRLTQLARRRRAHADAKRDASLAIDRHGSPAAGSNLKRVGGVWLVLYPRGRRGGKVRSLSAHMAKHMQLGPPPPQPGTLKWVELQRGAAYGSSKGSPREALGSAAAQAAGVEATAETKVAADAVSLAVKGRARGAAGKKAASRRRRPRKGLE